MTLKNIIIALMAVVIIFLLWQWQCRSKPEPNIPPVTPVAEIKAEVKYNEDSINAIITTLETELEQKDKLIEKASDELENGQSKSKQLLSENAALIAKLKAGELTDNINDNSEKLAAQIKKNDSLCNKNISLLTRKVTTKDAIINQKDRMYRKLKTSLDTCLKNQGSLEKYAKQVKVRNEVYAGISLNVYPIAGYGVDLGIKMKNGWMFEARALQMDGRTFGQVSAKHTIKLR